MTLFELLQRTNEENESNFENALALKNLKRRIEEIKKKKFDSLNSAFENGEIDAATYQTSIEKAKSESLVAAEQLKKLYAPQSKLNEICARLRESSAFISNNMMCGLLKSQTGTNWTFDVVEKRQKVARLYFSYESGEKFFAQAGILEDEGNLDFVIKKLKNINWFQEYINARQNKDQIFEISLVTGQEGFPFPALAKAALDNFFKHVQIDMKNPENLSFDDNRFDEIKEYVPRNFYYRYMRDKKSEK